MLFGSRLNKLATSIRRALSEYAVLGINPPFVADFIEKKYLTGGASSTFSNAINHARAGNATMTDGYGPELVTNGDDWVGASGTTLPNGASNVGWYQTSDGTYSVTSGVLTITNGTTGRTGFYWPISVTVGRTYEVEWAGITGGGQVRITDTVSPNDTTPFRSLNLGSSGTQNFVATASTLYVSFTNYDTSATTASIDSISVREMPAIKWAPHNLLTYSEDPSSSLTSTNDASWTTSNTLTATAQSGNQTPYARVLQTFTQKGTYVFAVETTSTTVQYLTLQTQIFDANANGVSVFDIQSGSVNTEASQHTATITATSEGFLCAIEFELDGTDLNGYLTMGLSEVSGIHRIVDPDGTESVTVTRLRSYRSDLGGMVDNPERGDSYVPTAVSLTGSNLVQNGDFATDSDWTKSAGWTISGGVASVDSVANSNPTLTQDIGATNDFYAVTLDVISTNGTGVLEVYHINLGASISFDISSTGTKTVYLNGGTHASNGQISLRARGGFIGSIDNVSVLRSAVKPNAARYLPRVGHHVYNGSAWVNEGVLAESESRTNLITHSQDFSDSSWVVKQRTGTLLFTDVGPDGQEDSAIKLIDNNAGGTGQVYISTGSMAVDTSSTYTYSVYAKKDQLDLITIYHASFTNPQNNGWKFYLDTGTISEFTGTPDSTATIQDVGNGWYRCAITFTTDSTDTVGEVRIYVGGAGAMDLDGTSSVLIYGAQFEKGSTPSSLIPTSGSSVTRPAETFTIPSANLPWPSPVYIGSELVTSGTFDDASALDDWSVEGDVSTTLSVDNQRLKINAPTTFDGAKQTLTTVVGKVYEIKVDYELGTSTRAGLRLFGTSTTQATASSGTITLIETATLTNPELKLTSGSSSGTVFFDNISVREINPLSVSIAMDGRVTYADTSTSNEAILTYWASDSSNFLRQRLRTDGSNSGAIGFDQSSAGTFDFVALDSYSPDILVPYNIASRHGSTFINGATEGVALTANTTPTALPDLSSTDLDLAYDYMGTISEFRVWDKDLGDAGIVEATNPSLEPSLSLTFEGVGTNSFTVSDWSE